MKKTLLTIFLLILLSSCSDYNNEILESDSGSFENEVNRNLETSVDSSMSNNDIIEFKELENQPNY